MTDNTSPNPVRIGVGIDTARYGHHVSFLDEQKRTAAQPFHFTETANGYQKLSGPSRSSGANIPICSCTFALMPPGSMPRTCCSGCISWTSRPRFPWGNPLATRPTAMCTSINARPIRPRVSRVLGLQWWRSRRPRGTIRRSFNNSAIPSHSWKRPPNNRRDWSINCMDCWPASFLNSRCL